MKKFLTFLCAFALVLAMAACSVDPDTDTDKSGLGNFANVGKNETEPALAEFEEIVVVDNENCNIRITGIEPDSLWGYSLKVLLENKSDNVTFMFSVESAAINNVSADPFFASEVAPGKKANETITFPVDELKENGVGDITDIQLDFNVYDSNDWTADSVAVASTHVYPYGEEKAISFVRESQSTDIVLADNDQVGAIPVQSGHCSANAAPKKRDIGYP